MCDWKKGDGATVGYVSDYYPYTVIEVNRNGKEVVIQEDRKNRVSGSWPDFQYEYIRDPFGRYAEQGFLVPGVYEGRAFRRLLGVFVKVLEQGLRAPASQLSVGPDLFF